MQLEWNTEELSHSVNFLDLTIMIDKQGKLSYQIFQKPMNPFLYIPGHSSHPPDVAKSLIHGLIQTYHKQNTKTETFNKNVQQLFRRLIARGRLHEDIHPPIFLNAAEKIDTRRDASTSSTNKQRQIQHLPKTRKKGRNDIFFHLPYHPRDISHN